jgi:Domain of unknown function (DUF4123)
MTASMLFDELWPRPLDDSGTRAFALLDAARDPQIYSALLRADCEWLCLYRGDAAVTMAEVAPYLVELEPQARFTWWLMQQGWGNSWGLFLHAPVARERLQAHFRRLVMAQMPDGKLAYFRFYDPRVMRVYLPTCTAAELETVFGPVERYIIESEDGREAVHFENREGELVQTPRSLTPRITSSI